MRGLAIVLVALGLAACAGQRAQEQLAAIEAACAAHEPEAPAAYRYCVLRQSYLATAAQSQLSQQSVSVARSIEEERDGCVASAAALRVTDASLIPLEEPVSWGNLSAAVAERLPGTDEEVKGRVETLRKGIEHELSMEQREVCHERAVALYVDWGSVLLQQDPATSIAISSAITASAAVSNAETAKRIERELKSQRDLCYMRQDLPC